MFFILNKLSMKKNIVSKKRMNIDLGGTAVNDIKIIGVSEVNFFYTPIIMFFVYFMVWINSL